MVRTPTKAGWNRINMNFYESFDAVITALAQLHDNPDGCIGVGALALTFV